MQGMVKNISSENISTFIIYIPKWLLSHNCM